MENSVLKEVTQNISFLVENRDIYTLKNLLLSTHPADIVDLFHNLDEKKMVYLFSLLPSDLASEVLADLDDYSRELVLENLEENRLTQIVEEMDSDDATDIVSELSAEKAEKILQNIDIEDSEEVRELLQYEEDTAGGIMALEYIQVNQNSTLDEAIQEIRRQGEDVEEIYYVYVIDDNEKLVGILPLKQLILMPGKTRVIDIMEKDLVTVSEDTDQEEVANIAKKYDMVAIPVVDPDGRLSGRITIDDIMDVVDEEASEDIHRMAGIANDEEIHETSAMKVSRTRLPWLLFAFVGEIGSAMIMSSFQASLEKIIIASFFIPIIMAMGGNAGIQSSTIMVRGLALGDIGLRHAKRQVFREFRVSVINGVVCGTLLMLVIGVWFTSMDHHLEFGAMLGISMFFIVINATLVGAVIPLFLKRVKIDPAIATGPFITTSNDIFGLLIYLGLATLFLQHYA
ncbi:magnesium transporter [bacterium]|nr:magnesium transporter [bacterium]